MSKLKAKRARRDAKDKAHRKPSHTVPKPTKPTANPSKDQKSAPAQKPQAAKPTQASQKAPIPYGEYDNILLVGEGDFSFTHSLVTHHGCASVVATSFDSEEDVRTKYPTFSSIHTELTALTPPVPFHHAIDATKLATYKALKAHGPYDTIAFQFPHVGGLSTDVNRQVRSNQALLVSFFQSCLQRTADGKLHKDADTHPFLRMGGRIVVTLFEGEPYTLWNIRDLARHAGLKVVESFRFDWTDYPGYKHVRTLGAIEGEGAWKGEDRIARTYVFEKVEVEKSDDEGGGKRGAKKSAKSKSKRKREESDSEDD